MDVNLFRLINNIAGQYDWLDRFGLIFGQDAIYLMGLLLVLLWIMDFGLTRKRNQYAVIMAVQALVIARGIIVPLLELIWSRPRPFLTLSDVNVLISTSQLDGGFPSGHATMAFALAFPVLIYNKKAGWWLIFLAVLISVGRVYIGVHYPSDILAGFFVVILVVLFLNFYRHIFIAPVVKLLGKK